jgi:hypothetical protein
LGNDIPIYVISDGDVIEMNLSEPDEEEND